MKIQYNPNITQISPLGGSFRVVGLDVLHNRKGFTTGKEIVYLKYIDSDIKIAIKCKDGKPLFKCCCECQKKNDNNKIRCDECSS